MAYKLCVLYPCCGEDQHSIANGQTMAIYVYHMAQYQHSVVTLFTWISVEI